MNGLISKNLEHPHSKVNHLSLHIFIDESKKGDHQIALFEAMTDGVHGLNDACDSKTHQESCRRGPRDRDLKSHKPHTLQALIKGLLGCRLT